MKAHERGIVVAVAGILAAVLFVFVFPKGAITTLMHEVLHLPGPGAGIAVILGPWAVFAALFSYRLAARSWSAFFTAVVFALAMGVFALAGVEGEAKGKFGSPAFMGGVALTGAVLSLGVRILGKRAFWIAGGIPGAAAGGVLLAFYWVVIFPPVAGWVAWKDVPLLLALALGGGFVAGSAALPAGRLLAPLLRMEKSGKSS